MHSRTLRASASVPRLRTLHRTLLPYTRADGSNDAKRIDQLQVTGTSRYEAFDVYFPLVYPKPEAAFALTVRPGSSREQRTLTVDAQSDVDRAAAFDAHAAGASGAADAPLWTFTRPNARAAYLKMPTWTTYNSKWNWQRFLDGVFSQLAVDRVPNLIIDLRGNEGGDDTGDVIVAHLIDTPLVPVALERHVRYRAIPTDLAPYLDTWDPSFKNWGDAARPLDNGFFRLVRPGVDDAANSSATFQFDQLVQQNHLATLAGTPTGGNQRGINGGAFFFIRLPNSGIEVDLPLIGTFPRAPARTPVLPPTCSSKPRKGASPPGGTPCLIRSWHASGRSWRSDHVRRHGNASRLTPSPESRCARALHRSRCRRRWPD